MIGFWAIELMGMWGEMRAVEMWNWKEGWSREGKGDWIIGE